MTEHSDLSGIAKASALFLVSAMALHVVTFLWLGAVVPGSVFFTTAAFGFGLGAWAWFLFHARLGFRYWQVFWMVILLTLITAALLLSMGLETAICLVLGLPLYVPSAALGIWAARLWLARRADRSGDGPKSRAVLLGLPLLVAAIEGQVAYPLGTAVVTTQIDIAAPPAVVWARTLEIAPIKASERIWTVSHHLLGAPQPVSAQLQGARRDLQWTKGVRFAEIITTRVENRHLAWRFTFDDPNSLAAFDPHVSPDSDRLRLTRGEYILDATPAGTRLTLQSHYRLNTPFNGYLKLWGARFLQDFHFSVLSVVKTRAEGAPG